MVRTFSWFPYRIESEHRADGFVQKKKKNSEEFWHGLTPEKAFLVRVFVDHCVSTKENARLEKVLPVVTAHAFRIQDAYNSLLDSLTPAEGGGDDEVADDREFILAELLRLALNLDYADEIGRRRLEQFVRTCGISVCVPCSSAELCWQDI